MRRESNYHVHSVNNYYCNYCNDYKRNVKGEIGERREIGY